jgi:hypothetical protein
MDTSLLITFAFFLVVVPAKIALLHWLDSPSKPRNRRVYRRKPLSRRA